MAIIKCKECDEKISDTADSCPHCGYSVKEEKDKKAQGIGCLVMIFIAVALWFWIDLSGPSTPTPWYERDNSAMALVQVESYVKEQLVSPATATFPSMWSGEVGIARDGTTYTISSHVDSQNRMGGVLRTRFVAQVKEVTDGRWEIIAFERYD